VRTVPVVTGTGSPGLIAVPDGTVVAVLANLDGSMTQSRLTGLGGVLQWTFAGRVSPDIGAS
jgi:hypothetical protein